MTSFKSRLITTVIWWAWMPTGAYVIWLALRYGLSGMGTWSQYWRLTVVQRMWLPGGTLTHPTGLFWLWVAIGLIGTAAIFTITDDDLPTGEVAVAIVAVLAALGVLAVPFTRAIWDNDKDEGRFYNQATTWHIADGANPPASLTYLMRGAHRGVHGCAYRSPADVYTCVQVDALPGITSWEGRTSSYASAQQMMTHAASIASNVDVWDASLTYLYGTPPQAGRAPARACGRRSSTVRGRRPRPTASPPGTGRPTPSRSPAVSRPMPSTGPSTAPAATACRTCSGSGTRTCCGTPRTCGGTAGTATP
ncbi:hypothetical protein GCM10029978_067040 [Actinoallomurus acanthiterrae]